MIAPSDIQQYLDKYDDSNVELVTDSTRKAKFIFRINTEWLNEMKDAMSVYLIKKTSTSPWVLTDDGSTNFESKVSGLYDKHDLALKAYQKLSRNTRYYFIKNPIEFDPKDESYYLVFHSLKRLDDELHYFIQMMIEHINSAVLVTTYRDLQAKQNKG